MVDLLASLEQAAPLHVAVDLQRTITILSRSGVIRDLLVRGSLASGTCDELSDIDLVVGVADESLPQFVQILDALMSTTCGALFPGWRDTYVGRWGGLGYVYLLPRAGRLRQLDLYVTPASTVTRVRHVTGAVPLWRSNLPCAPAAETRTFIEREHARPVGQSDFVVAALVFLILLTKRVRRRQPFLVYGDSYLLFDTLRSLLRSAFAPASSSWGWYNVEHDIAASDEGRTCLGILRTLVESPPLSSLDQVEVLLDRVLTLVRLAVPEVHHQLELSLDAYAHYLTARA